MTPLEAAHFYHGLGWSILPMKMEAKQPACRWKRYQSQRAGEQRLAEWWGNGSNYGMATIFGAISGNLGSRDFDSMESYTRWASEHPNLANGLPTVATKRGRHVYFTTDPAAVAGLRARLGKPSGTGAIAGTDGELRIGVGCYSIVPPSRRNCGFTYEWLKPIGELPIIDVVAAGLLPVPLNREHRDEQRDPKTLADGADGAGDDHDDYGPNGT